MKLSEMLAKLKTSSKSEDIPGTVESYLDELCPSCQNKLKLMKPCCGSPNGTKQCSCGYKIQL